ncbi:MAG: cytochrome b [Rhodobacteraceae bacterium]|nr:cytochrome b [Paracoccaceae bacterium]
MGLSNTDRVYGFVTKALHWLMFLMILTVIPLGLVAAGMAQDLRNPDIASTGADFTRTFLLFSLHKTLGLAIFLTALMRILWAATQSRPGLLNPDRPVGAFAARTVHWLLYSSLLLVPLTGWLTHAATSGFAPIWWPFGQSLPFVPKDDALAATLAGVHMVMQRVMMLSIALHIIGTLKHHFVDRDATLRRMLPGGRDIPAPPKQSQTQAQLHGPILVALALWATALAIGVGLGFIAP